MLTSIRIRNALFDTLSAAEKRVAVAKDVITQIQLGELLSRPSTYVTVNERGCNVCAIGAAAVSLMNGDAIGRSDSDLREALSEFFPKEMLREMEAYFEGGDSWGADYIYPNNENYVETSYDWNESEEGYKKRIAEEQRAANAYLISVFQHIVDNNGEWDAVKMGGVLEEDDNNDDY